MGKPFVCKGKCTHANCNKRFRTQSLLNDHCRHRIAPYNAEKIKCQHCDKKFSKSGLYKHGMKLHESLVCFLTEMENEIKIKTEEIQIKVIKQEPVYPRTIVK